MQNEWILDVLTDLRTFAQNNDLGALADQLENTRLLAATEMASLGEGPMTHDCSAAATSRGHIRAARNNI